MLPSSRIPQRLSSLCCLHARGMASKAKNTRRRQSTQPTQPTYSTETLSHTSLPSAKMRALVALYHQSETWITPENLLARIDHTFVISKSQNTPETTGPHWERSITYDEIEKAKRVILNAPKMSKWDLTAGDPLNVRYESNAGNSWSNNRATRERKVIEALYGVVTTQEKMLPGLEVVKESEGWIKKANESDK